MANKTISLTEEELEWYGEDFGWKVEVIYEQVSANSSMFFYSPDGVGRVWFDTKEELLEDCLLVSNASPVVTINIKKGN